ncbi:MAG: hypothetical protein M5U10_08490 [Candidatus Methanoperedens sp.]|nr:hypothetical protein [Candidatus Methanoperedens sp.]
MYGALFGGTENHGSSKPEILLVYEMLAVRDAGLQKLRCLDE